MIQYQVVVDHVTLCGSRSYPLPEGCDMQSVRRQDSQCVKARTKLDYKRGNIGLMNTYTIWNCWSILKTFSLQIYIASDHLTGSLENHFSKIAPAAYLTISVLQQGSCRAANWCHPLRPSQGFRRCLFSIFLLSSLSTEPHIFLYLRMEHGMSKSFLHGALAWVVSYPVALIKGHL